MLRHVAAGIDGSPEGLAAAHWAAREAMRRGTALRLVHAWEWQPRPAPSVPADMSQRSWAEDMMAQTSDSMRAAHFGLQVITHSVADAPVGALLAAAEEADLLVLGSRGISGVAGFLTGSVSQRVVARSPRPVVLVRAGSAPPTSTSRRWTESPPTRYLRPRTARSCSASTRPGRATN